MTAISNRPPLIAERPATQLRRLKQTANLLRVLCHPLRLQMVDFLCRIPSPWEASVSDVQAALHIKQPALASQYLIQLKHQHILTSRKEKTNIFYSIAQNENTSFVLELVTLLQKQINSAT